MPTTDRRTVRTEDLDPELTDVSRRVIGAAIEVHKTLGPGFEQGVYERALAEELKQEDIPFIMNHAIPVLYKGTPVGEQTLCMYINDRFVVNIMNHRRNIDGIDRARLRSQLRCAGLELGLIINFAEHKLKDGLVRVLNPDKIKDICHEQQHDESGGHT